MKTLHDRKIKKNILTLGHTYKLFSYRGLVLVEDLVVLGHGDAEDDGRHVLEAVDPLLPLRPLPSHVKQPGE